MRRIQMHALLTIVLVAGLVIYGCGKERSNPEGSRLVAKINNYEMTVADFKDEAKKDPAKAKEELLEELIIKKVLLQEAQRQNFDKDKAFMKEIERYWEQALLKLLIKKKTKELAQRIVVDEDEVRREYERMVKEEGQALKSFEKIAPEIRSDIKHRKIQESLNIWILDVRNKADVKEYKENLKGIKVE